MFFATDFALPVLILFLSLNSWDRARLQNLAWRLYFQEEIKPSYVVLFIVLGQNHFYSGEERRKICQTRVLSQQTLGAFLHRQPISPSDPKWPRNCNWCLCYSTLDHIHPFLSPLWAAEGRPTQTTSVGPLPCTFWVGFSNREPGQVVVGGRRMRMGYLFTQPASRRLLNVSSISEATFGRPSPHSYASRGPASAL